MSTIEYQIDHVQNNEQLRDDLEFSLQELRRARDIVKSLSMHLAKRRVQRTR